MDKMYTTLKVIDCGSDYYDLSKEITAIPGVQVRKADVFSKKMR